jgi:hypothetical protein
VKRYNEIRGSVKGGVGKPLEPPRGFRGSTDTYAFTAVPIRVIQNAEWAMKTLLILYVLSGAMLAAVAAPLMLRRVPPNPLYGFRVPKTLNNPNVWYEINAYSGTHLFWIGLGTIVFTAALSLIPHLSVGTYALACATFVLGSLAVSLFFSFRYLNRL